ncbi:MAG TPA: type II toxin-antitoxin system VapC family toxin [Candidatus Nanoarchaeia archaeon]|nr:type II toxin-antitoxin system VapC family toxin [Candidatus Nanoarchaeia archaeon]
MYVLDSSALIEIIEGHSSGEKVIGIVGDAPLVTTSICEHEVLAGALSEKQAFVLDGLFSSMRILEHDARAARLGASIEQELRKKGTMINKLDILIAAICVVHNAELVTFDKDFSKIKNLRDLRVRII